MLNNFVLETIARRASIRAYSAQPLPQDELAALKCTALAVPTAVNARSQRFLFITNSQILDEIEQAVVKRILASGDAAAIQRTADRKNKVLYDAPLFVMIAVDPNNAYGKVDAGIAVQNLALAAKSMGLDSVILGMPSMAFSGEGSDLLKQKIGFPAGLEYAIGIAIGHRAMDKAPHDYDLSHIIDVK